MRARLLGLFGAATAMGVYVTNQRRQPIPPRCQPALFGTASQPYHRLYDMMNYPFDVRVSSIAWFLHRHRTDLDKEQVFMLADFAIQSGHGSSLNLFAKTYPQIISADWLEKQVIQSPLLGKLSYALLQEHAANNLAPSFARLMSADEFSSLKIFPLDDDKKMAQYQAVLAKQAPGVETEIVRRGDNPHDNDEMERVHISSDNVQVSCQLSR